ncbi:hypothetical protein C8Q72DRAFT_839540 [Fomitopsis betulina]|nr:hypothetical protein C8Q72DRAFT_839540 [Fomitopsis betulina]
MPQQGAKVHRKPTFSYDQHLKARVKDACCWLDLQEPHKGLLREASLKFSIPYYKLYGHYCKKTRAPREAHNSQRILDNTQEAVLAGWVKFWGDEGLPVDCMGLQIKAKEISGGSLPSTEWVKAVAERVDTHI